MSVPNSGPAAPPPPVWDARPAGGSQVAYGGFWIRLVAYIIDAILISLEPVSPSETHWVVYQLAPRIKNGKPLDIEQARKDANFVQESGILEDRHAAREIQAGLASGANTHFTFGYYEQAIGHLSGFGEEATLLRAIARYVVVRDP